MKIKKILIVSSALTGFGGMETVVRKVIKLLQEDEPEVKIKLYFFNHNHTKEDKTWLEKNENISIESNISNHKLKRFSFSLSLAKEIFTTQPNVMIALDPLSCYIANLARKILFKKIPLLSWSHFSLNKIYRSDYSLRADAHLAISSGIARQLKAMGVPDTKIYTIFNPVSPADIIIPRPSTGTKFLYLGRIQFEEQKRIKDLLDALALVSGDWSLDVVGDGPDLEKCKQYAFSLGISEKITWHGWQPSPWKYIVETIQTVSAAVMTSAYEGFSMVIAETIARGCYFVTSNCPTGPEDIIIEQLNGELYQPGDLQHLQNILQDIVEGKALPEQTNIQTSIKSFYDDIYFSHLKQAIIETMKMSK